MTTRRTLVILSMVLVVFALAVAAVLALNVRGEEPLSA